MTYQVQSVAVEGIRQNGKVKAHRLIWLVQLVKSEDTNRCGQRKSTIIRSEDIKSEEDLR